MRAFTNTILTRNYGHPGLKQLFVVHTNICSIRVSNPRLVTQKANSLTTAPTMASTGRCPCTLYPPRVEMALIKVLVYLKTIYQGLRNALYNKHKIFLPYLYEVGKVLVGASNSVLIVCRIILRRLLLTIE